MSYLLDTNICSAYLKRPGKLTHRVIQHSGRLSIPTIVLGELFAWAYRKVDPTQLLRCIERDLLADIDVIDFEQAVLFQCRGELYRLSPNDEDLRNVGQLGLLLLPRR